MVNQAFRIKIAYRSEKEEKKEREKEKKEKIIPGIGRYPKEVEIFQTKDQDVN